jgi:hypothetical protein
MSLAPGTRIGPYEVLSVIGAGGMGEVYLARDPRLQRNVALKILPEIFAADPDRRARLEREAQVLASLSHPHIGAIYGFEDADGLHALVLELVEGETLAERIARGPIPVDEALPLARQLAEALDAAHEQGIVHRDLKPANIKITPQGVVKVLDFGLAKLADDSSSGAMPSSPSLNPTMTAQPLTQVGMLLGTAAYMSPEQAKGRQADKRSDIWAFGCVLYEMLAGRTAFHGNSIVDTIGAVLHSEPAWEKLPSEIPGSTRRLLTRCLQKDRRTRLRDIGDGLWDLTSAVAPNEVVHRSRRWVVAAAAVALAIAAAGAWWGRASRPSDMPRLALSVVPRPGLALIPEISPDGSTLAYFVAPEPGRGLYIRPVDAPTDRRVPGSEKLTGPAFWSAESTTIMFPTAQGLVKVRLPDGAPELVSETAGVNPAIIPRGGSCSDDGTVLTSSSGRLLRMPIAGGRARPVRVGGMRAGEYLNPEFLPGGTNVLFLFVPDDGGEPEVYLGTLQDDVIDRAVLLFRNETAAKFTPAGGGRLLYVRNDSLYAQRVDVQTRTLRSEPVLVASGVRSMAGILGFRAYFSVARSGTVAWRPGGAEQAQVTRFSRGKEPATATGPPSPVDSIVLSPDEGRLLAFSPRQAWIIEPAQTSRMPLPKGIRWFGWSRKDAAILGLRAASADGISRDHSVLVERPIDIVGETQSLGAFTAPLPNPQDRSPDGLVVLGVAPEGAAVLWARANGSVEERMPKALIETGQQVVGPRFSPDGRWIHYHSRESATKGALYVQPFPGPGRRRQVTSEGMFPEWRRDGREIIYRLGDSIWSVTVTIDGTDLRFGAPHRLFAGVRLPPPGATIVSRPLAISKDGSYIFVAQATQQPDTDVIHLQVGALGRASK